MALIVCTAFVLVRFALPTPPDRIRQSDATDDDLRKFLQGTLIQPQAAPHSELIALGGQLFRDQNFLAGGTVQHSCESCHTGDSKSRFEESDRSPPNLARSRFYERFGIDGRSPDMETFIASHLESRNELSLGRVRISRNVLTHHRAAYERAFNNSPAVITEQLPEDGSPSLDMREFPVAVSSHILETIADKDLLRTVLSQAQTEHLAPAVIVSKMVFLPRMPDSQRTESYYRLPRATQEPITLVFENSIKAIAAYIKQLPIDESAFDRFAKRVANGESLENALTTEFGAEELTGLRLFHGPAGCARCHHGPGLADNRFHNLGLPSAKQLDAGRAVGLVIDDHMEPCVTTIALPPSPFPSVPLCPTAEEVSANMIAAVGSFRTPSLRTPQTNRPLTHNGQIDNYEEMLTFYSRLNDRPAIGRRSMELVPLMLTKEETSALLAFLASLSDGKTLMGSASK